MGYADTKLYTLDAATTGLADIIAALITHFTTAPGRWELKSSTAGQALVIREKTTSTQEIAIRRVGTTELGVTVSPDESITAPGDATTEPTKGADASPECRTGALFGAINARFFVLEHDDAVTILFQDSPKNHFDVGIHAGVILEPLRPGWDALGITGHGVLVGEPDAAATNSWSNTSTQANGSRLRSFNSSGANVWLQCLIPDLNAAQTATGSFSGGTADGAILPTVPYMMRGLDINGSNDCNLGLSKWLGIAPLDATFLAQLPRVRNESGTDEAWLYFDTSASTTLSVVSTERGVNIT